MLKIVLFAVAAIAPLAVAPAIAAPVPVSAGTNLMEGAPVASQTAPAKPTPRAAVTRYCVVGIVTGSIIPHKECRTRAEWIDLTGIDPLDKN